jgi:hypothetical protein
MPCHKCQQIPNTHSFKVLGKTLNGLTLLYSKPFDALEHEFTQETIQCYYSHLDELQGQWIWLFDAKDLHKRPTPKLELLRSFYKGVEERYKDNLQCIYIFHPNWQMQAILNVIRPFMKLAAKKRLVESPSALELLALGMDGAIVKSLLS